MSSSINQPAGAIKAKASRKCPLPTTLYWIVAGVVLQHLPLAAQEADISPAVRDSFSISSGYFSNDYANNIDYAQFTQDVKSASGRLALYGSEKYSNHLDGWVSRGLYLLGSSVLMDMTGITTTYHEWGHASRSVALGGTAKLYSCCTDITKCEAPRDFFGYARAQLFNFKGGSTAPYNTDTANSESGRAKLAMVHGAGVNNQILIADRFGEQHFLKGSDNIFTVFYSAGNQAIAGYGSNGDISSAANVYRSTGLDSSISDNNLVQINQLSVLSGSMLTLYKGMYDYAKTGNTQVKPWTINGFLVPNQYNYLTSHGITRKWVSGYEWDETTKILGSYEYVVRGDSFAEPGVGVYKNFGGWDALVKVSGKTMDWANLETAFSMRLDKNWKLTATAYVWDSRSLLGERNSLNLSSNKTRQASIGVAYEY